MTFTGDTASTSDTLYVSAATSEALITAAGFTQDVLGCQYRAPSGEKYWVRSEAAQHAIRIILNQQETR